MQISYLRQAPVVWVALAMSMSGVAMGQKQKDKAAGYDRAARATVLHSANVYVAADADSQRISLVTPGHEVVGQELSEFCRERLASYKVPRIWRFVDQFPQTASNKIQKYVLRELYLAGKLPDALGMNAGLAAAPAEVRV